MKNSIKKIIMFALVLSVDFNDAYAMQSEEELSGSFNDLIISTESDKETLPKPLKKLHHSEPTLNLHIKKSDTGSKSQEEVPKIHPKWPKSKSEYELLQRKLGYDTFQSLSEKSEESDYDNQNLSQLQDLELNLFRSKLKKERFLQAQKTLVKGIYALDEETVRAAIEFCPKDKYNELLCIALPETEMLTALSYLIKRHGDNVTSEFKNVFTLLVNAGAKEFYGYTPLHIAAVFNKPNVAFYLIKNDLVDVSVLGAQKNARQTALHLAFDYDAHKVIDVLLNPKIYKNKKKLEELITKADFCGRTPLHYAATKDDAQNFIMLYELGAGQDLNVRDKDGFTPSEYAPDNGKVEKIITIIKQSSKNAKISKNKNKNKKK